MENALRFGLLIIIGMIIIFYYYYRGKRRKIVYENHIFHKAIGTVIEVVSELRKGQDKSGYRYKIRVKYETSEMSSIVAVSKDTVYSKRDYHEGELIEIFYREDEPEIFYLADDKEFQKSNTLILIWGLFICFLGLILMILYWS